MKALKWFRTRISSNTFLNETIPIPSNKDPHIIEMELHIESKTKRKLLMSVGNK